MSVDVVDFAYKLYLQANRINLSSSLEEMVEQGLVLPRLNVTEMSITNNQKYEKVLSKRANFTWVGEDDAS